MEQGPIGMSVPRIPRQQVAGMLKMSLNDLYEIIGQDPAFPSGIGYFGLPNEEIIEEDSETGQIREFEDQHGLEADHYAMDRIEVEKHDNRWNGRQILSSIRVRVQKLICEDWQYCKKKSKYSDEVALSYAVAGMVGTLMPQFRVDSLYAITAVLMKRGLDRMCHCSTRDNMKREDR